MIDLPSMMHLPPSFNARSRIAEWNIRDPTLVSTADKGSSNSNTSAFLYKARARPIRARFDKVYKSI